MPKKISKPDLINILIFAACALASAILFLTTVEKEMNQLERKQWTR
jgi:hypothetical protein